MSATGRQLGEAWYMDYASGGLSEGERVLLDAHIEISDAASAIVADHEAVGGAYLDSLAANDHGAEDLPFSVESLFARMEADGEIRKLQPDVAAFDDGGLGPIMPRALHDFLQEKQKNVSWGFLGPGLRKAILWDGPDGSRLWLLKAQPGVSIPQHGHRGSELTLVLSGSFYDGEERFFRGDVEEADGETEHAIQIGEDGECVCLALTQGKLRFDNPLLKGLQLVTGL